MNDSCSNCSSCNFSQEDQYEEFIPDKEYAIGEFFKIGNEAFKVVEFKNISECCLECDFNTFEYKYYCYMCKCAGGERSTEDIVEFILYDTLEENE